MSQVLKVDDLKRRNFMGTKPNVYKRSLEVREFTNAYLAEMQRQAAGIEEPVHRKMKIKVWLVALLTLAAVGLAIGLVLL